MSAMKAYIMSPDGEADAQLAVDRAQARLDAILAAASLASPHIDAATLDDLTHEAAYQLGEACELLALARGGPL